jgi:hypothetical protein
MSSPRTKAESSITVLLVPVSVGLVSAIFAVTCRREQFRHKRGQMVGIVHPPRRGTQHLLVAMSCKRQVEVLSRLP